MTELSFQQLVEHTEQRGSQNVSVGRNAGTCRLRKDVVKQIVLRIVVVVAVYKVQQILQTVVGNAAVASKSQKGTQTAVVVVIGRVAAVSGRKEIAEKVIGLIGVAVSA